MPEIAIAPQSRDLLKELQSTLLFAAFKHLGHSFFGPFKGIVFFQVLRPAAAGGGPSGRLAAVGGPSGRLAAAGGPSGRLAEGRRPFGSARGLRVGSRAVGGPSGRLAAVGGVGGYFSLNSSAERVPYIP